MNKKTTIAHKAKRISKPGWPFGQSVSPVFGECSLWAAVITQALMDALSKARSTEALLLKQEAIRWLTENGQDFTMVCLFAGYDPDYVRKQAKKVIANPRPWRAEPGKGKRYLERKEYRKKQKMQQEQQDRPRNRVMECNV